MRHFLPNLKYLFLTATNTNDHMLVRLLAVLKDGKVVKNKGVRKLESLSIASTVISARALRYLSRTLKSLDIRCCPLIKKNLKTAIIRFEKFKNLERLKMDCISDPDVYSRVGQLFGESLVLFELADSKTLFWAHKYLLRRSQVSDARDITNLKKLKSLRFGAKVYLNQQILDLFGDAFKELRFFAADFYPLRMSGDDQRDVYNNGTISSFQFISKWKHLERLELFGSRYLDNMSIEALVGLENLYYLNLSSTPNLRDVGFASQIIRLKSLTTLIVESCINLGRFTIQAAAKMAETIGPNKVFSLSMLASGVGKQYKPKLRGKKPEFPANFRVTWSDSKTIRVYYTFDGVSLEEAPFGEVKPHLTNYFS